MILELTARYSLLAALGRGWKAVWWLVAGMSAQYEKTARKMMEEAAEVELLVFEARFQGQVVEEFALSPWREMKARLRRHSCKWALDN